MIKETRGYAHLPASLFYTIGMVFNMFVVVVGISACFEGITIGARHQDNITSIISPESSVSTLKNKRYQTIYS